MSLRNDKFKGKASLDKEVESYREFVYGHFAYLRKIGKAVKLSRKYFYPVMVGLY